jgi:hypothetical protein
MFKQDLMRINNIDQLLMVTEWDLMRIINIGWYFNGV